MHEELLRCEVTGNPSGTDAWGNGSVCLCGGCREWLRQNPQFFEPPRLVEAPLTDFERNLVSPSWPYISARSALNQTKQGQ